MVRVMGFVAFALAALILSALTSSAKPVAAQEPGIPCGAEVAAVGTQIDEAKFLNSKDEAGLLGKVESAERKLGEGKSADAVAALNGIRVKVEALLGAGKVDAVGGQAILDATAAAVACLESPPVVA